MGRIPPNGNVKGVPGGVVHIGRLMIKVILVI